MTTFILKYIHLNVDFRLSVCQLLARMWVVACET